MAQEAHDREAERRFWNQKAEDELGPEESVLLVRAEDRYDHTKDWLPYLGIPKTVDRLLEMIGDLQGKKVLDLGAGTGFLSVLLALHGAEVIAIDVAEDALIIGRRRAELSGVSHAVKFQQMSCELLEFADQSLDIVTGLFVLHHLDLDKVGPEICRVLKPGGKAIFLETCGYNRLLIFCRDTLAGRFGILKASSPGERPISREDVKVLEKAFPSEVKMVFPELLFLRMLPAYVRVFRWEPIRSLALVLDRLLWWCKPLRSLSYFGLIELATRTDNSPSD